MFKLTTIAAACLFTVVGAHAAVEINGNTEMIANVKNSPLIAIAGANSSAAAEINVIDGKVKISGNASLKATVENSPLIAIAGANSSAAARVNVIRGN